MMPPQLQVEVEQLRKDGLTISVMEMPDGFIHLIFDEFILPSGYTQVKSRLLVKFPQSYPNGKPDMFWLEESVKLTNGAVPLNAEQIEQNHDQTWRRFSWHLSKWVPGVDNLNGYLEFVRIRLNHKK